MTKQNTNQSKGFMDESGSVKGAASRRTNPAAADPDSTQISRRAVLRHVTALLGGVALTGSGAWGALAFADTPEGRMEQAAKSGFSAQDVELLNEIADTILPETDTPGAKEAAVGPFIALMVNDTYTQEQQAVFHAGLDDFKADCLAKFDQSFMALDAGRKLELVTQLDQQQHDYMNEQKERNKDKADDEKDTMAHYFRMIKELTVLGYYTSELGATQALRYIETPGGYQPCVPYNGEPSWS